MTARQLRHRLLRAMDAAHVSVHGSRIIREVDMDKGSFRTLGGYASTPDPTKGYKHFVFLNEYLPIPAQTATLAHEWAHILLGHTSQHTRKSGQTTARNEVEASNVAMLVVSSFGIEDALASPKEVMSTNMSKTNRPTRYKKIEACVNRIKRGIEYA